MDANATAALNDAQKTAHIKAVVTEAGQALRARHPWLRHQDAIGVAILAFGLGGMLGCAWLYGAGLIPAWLCIPLVALFASLTHELEHDLIHWMYFRTTPWAHHAMMALVWLARPSTINPWIRRELHFHHHKHSGTASDREERGITNGEPWGLVRVLMMGDLIVSMAVRVWRAPDRRQALRVLGRSLAVLFPLTFVHYGLWYAFLGFHLADALGRAAGAPIAWAPGTLDAMGVVDFLAVVWIAPNVLRGFCLHFVSSNMHYYGDVEDGNVVQQTQVLAPWWMAPFNLFCFNFGSTHAIHHFVVKEPFYVRQATAAAAHRVMREMGVRFDDLGTFRRANRWNEPGAGPAVAA